MAVGTWQQTVIFYGQMRQIVRTGLTLSQAIPLAAGSSAPHRQLAAQWVRGIEQGQPWHQQLSQSNERPLICALIRAGENSGRIEEMCEEIVSFYQNLLTIKRLIISRAVYPVILIHMVMVIPALVPVVAKGANPLTLFIGPGLLWLTVAVGILLWRVGKRSGWTAAVARRPPLSALTLQMVTTNSALVLRAGISAGMLYHEALEQAADSCGNALYGAAMRREAGILMRSEDYTLTQALSNVGWPQDMLNVLASGEHSGAVERSLQQITEIARERFQSRLTWTARVLMGILLAIAMIYAAITIISMYMSVVMGPMQEALNY